VERRFVIEALYPSKQERPPRIDGEPDLLSRQEPGLRRRGYLCHDPTARRSLRRQAAVAGALMTPPPDPEATERAARIVAKAEEALRGRARTTGR
jgi:hypothetical protein